MGGQTIKASSRKTLSGHATSILKLSKGLSPSRSRYFLSSQDHSDKLKIIIKNVLSGINYFDPISHLDLSLPAGRQAKKRGEICFGRIYSDK